MSSKPYSYSSEPVLNASLRRKWLHIVGPFGGVLLTLSGILMIWFGTLYFSRNERANTERSAVTLAGNLSRTFEEHIIRSIRAVDQTLLYVRDSYARNPAKFDISLWSNDSQFLTGISFQVVIIGADGRMVASNIPGSSPGLDLSDREHFRIHTTRTSDELFISKPVFGRVSKKWSIQFTRPIYMRDGSFGGVAVVSVDPEYLGRFYETIDIGSKGVISLVGIDGIVRARGSRGQAMIGESVAKGQLLQAYEKADTGTYKAESQLDKIERIFVYRKVKDFPLLVVVGLAVSEVFSPFERSRNADFIYASLLTCWLLGIAFVMWRYQHSLRTSRDAAEAGTRARSEFLAMMSHEIRTPLNGVIGMADVLLASGLNTQQSTHANVMRDSAQHLLTILNDVLDFSKLEADRVEIENVPFDLHETMRSSVALLRSMADEKNLWLRAEIAADVPRRIVGDPARLRQVLFNLISNGLKFTPKGGVTVALRKINSVTGPLLEVSVTDTGVGIPEDGMALLFREFSQIDSTVARRFGGTGLGLAICKRLVELMGGSITVKSTLGEGTTFSFELPCEQAPALGDEMLPQIEAPVLVPAHAGEPRILLAEDNKTNQIVITKLLESIGLKADTVENGAAAVKACRETVYDLVLMDVMMPEMDGLTATRAIRELPSPFSDCRIVALTANAQTHDREVCLEAGMDDFLAKPVTRLALQSKLAAYRPKTSGAENPDVATSAGFAEPALFDTAIFDELRDALGPEDCNLVVRTFVSDAPQRMSVMQNSAREGDRSAVKREAHAIKSAAGSLGFMQFSSAAAALERDALGLSANDCLSRLSMLERLYKETTNALRQRYSAVAAIEMQ